MKSEESRRQGFEIGREGKGTSGRESINAAYFNDDDDDPRVCIKRRIVTTYTRAHKRLSLSLSRRTEGHRGVTRILFLYGTRSRYRDPF